MPKYAVEDLLAIMARLRGPDGCPWDREQTHQSLLPHLIEEAYEFLDAVENRDFANMREELGDLLLQIVFHAQLAHEAGRFDFGAVVRELSEKLIRRHPHVFGDVKLEGTPAVERQWEDLKRREKPETAGEGPKSVMQGLPRRLPPLPKAVKIQKRAAGVGFDWPDARGPLQKLKEEVAELERELEGGDRDRIADELGDVLFSVANLARKLDLDPESALAGTNAKFLHRFRRMESLMAGAGAVPDEVSLAQLDAYWEKAKASEADTDAGR